MTFALIMLLLRSRRSLPLVPDWSTSREQGNMVSGGSACTCHTPTNFTRLIVLVQDPH